MAGWTLLLASRERNSAQMVLNELAHWTGSKLSFHRSSNDDEVGQIKQGIELALQAHQKQLDQLRQPIALLKFNHNNLLHFLKYSIN